TSMPQPLSSGATGAASASRSHWRPRALLGVKLVLTGGLLAWLLGTGQIDLRKLLAVPCSIDLAILAALTITALALPACRWWWLLRLQGLPVPLGRVAAMTWVGYVTQLLLPGAASGDVARSYLILQGG